ncbi:MAG: hypothetical protein OEY51_12765, partial [Cyclobacteriaceae bacterium]|nr:hypothetical protein [Cyclobacteriaceae bacterium]
ASRSYFIGLGIGYTYYLIDPLGVHIEASTSPFMGKLHFSDTFEVGKDHVKRYRFSTLSVGLIYKFSRKKFAKVLGLGKSMVSQN